jgi:nitrite reductase/ring-hydroxylating ferredoxin subunit
MELNDKSYDTLNSIFLAEKATLSSPEVEPRFLGLEHNAGEVMLQPKPSLLQELRTIGEFVPASLKFVGAKKRVAFFTVAGTPLIAFKNWKDRDDVEEPNDGSVHGLVVVMNKCMHECGTFKTNDIEGTANTCTLTCSNHGWKLDLSTRLYVNPLGFEQPVLPLENFSQRRVMQDSFGYMNFYLPLPGVCCALGKP